MLEIIFIKNEETFKNDPNIKTYLEKWQKILTYEVGGWCNEWKINEITS